MIQAEVVRALIPLLGKKMDIRSAQSFFSQIIRGQRTLPTTWEQPLLTVTKCANRAQLQKQYPALRFADTGDTTMYEIAVTFSETVALVPAVRVLDVLRALQLLQEFGIKSDVRIRATE